MVIIIVIISIIMLLSGLSSRFICGAAARPAVPAEPLSSAELTPADK